MNALIVLPFIVPLVTGFSALLRRRPARRLAFLVGMLINLAVALWLLVTSADPDTSIRVSQMGDHPAPYGISLVVDSLSAIMLIITAVIALAAGVFSFVTIDANRERFAYYPLIAFMIAGINFAFLTGDLFTLFVSFEIMLMASFVLLTLGGERGQIEGGIKYVTLNLISSTIFLVAAGLTYTAVGTLNMAHLVERVAAAPGGITTILTGLFFVAFGIKAALFPMFFWLPASYHTPPVAITALFGALLTKVGIYALWRVVVMIFPQDVALLQPIILAVAALTMITGVLGAVAQNDFRRLLSFHIVSQIGYLLMGIGIGTPAALAGAIFFVVHVMLVKTGLFFVSGIVHEQKGTFWLKKLGGMSAAPFVGILFFLGAMSLAGVPPFSGFWAKLSLIRAGLESGQYAIIAIALVVSLLTLYSMIKIWHEVFWKPAPAAAETRTPSQSQRRVMIGVTGALAAVVLLISAAPQPLFDVATRAAALITDPAPYVQTVLYPADALLVSPASALVQDQMP